MFAPVVAKFANVLHHAEVVTFPGSGHIPHVTLPDAYVEAITIFTRKHQL
jgi:pimeloyl-ACP methyl ester carboxylesterase